MSAPLSPYPDELRQLISSNTTESNNFREHIRQYNNANAFASFGAKLKICVHSFDSLCIQVLDTDQQGRHNDYVLTDNIVFNKVL